MRRFLTAAAAVCMTLGITPLAGGALGTAAGAAQLSYFAAAKHQWELGAKSSSAGQGGYWHNAAEDLTAGVAAKVPAAAAYKHAAAKLLQLASLPNTMATPAQQKEGLADTEAINSFFGTNGLYDVSAPSSTTAQFVATLQQEARIGTLQVTPDAALHKPPSAYPGAAVNCPVLSSLAVNSTFGCKMTTSKIGTYYFVGQIFAAHAVTYVAEIAKGSALFDCEADGLSRPEELAAKRMDGGCITSGGA
jgi:hypothetical protein